VKAKEARYVRILWRDEFGVNVADELKKYRFKYFITQQVWICKLLSIHLGSADVKSLIHLFEQRLVVQKLVEQNAVVLVGTQHNRDLRNEKGKQALKTLYFKDLGFDISPFDIFLS
jgi:hypothetical protein